MSERLKKFHLDMAAVQFERALWSESKSEYDHYFEKGEMELRAAEEMGNSLEWAGEDSNYYANER